MSGSGPRLPDGLRQAAGVVLQGGNRIGPAHTGFRWLSAVGSARLPGQGTALVGVLDPFWDSKPYISPDEFRRFCGPTVPLARLPKRTWTSDETFVADIEVSHFGPAAMSGVTPNWTVNRGAEVVETGPLTGVGHSDRTAHATWPHPVCR